jgi:hypothetical protein
LGSDLAAELSEDAGCLVLLHVSEDTELLRYVELLVLRGVQSCAVRARTMGKLTFLAGCRAQGGLEGIPRWDNMALDPP